MALLAADKAMLLHTSYSASQSVLPSFPTFRYHPPMAQDPEILTPAAPQDVIQSLAYALMYNGRKRGKDFDEIGALITAQRLAEYLRISGYVVMKKHAPLVSPSKA